MSALQNNMDVFIIIPVYNEEKVIRKVIGELLQHPYQVVVVNDGSTQDIETGILDLPIHYIKHCVNMGQGAALQTGLEYATEKGAAYLVTFDSDGQHRVEDIESLLAPLKTGTADIALGTRFGAQAYNNAPAIKRFTLLMARWVNFFFTGMYLSDAHNGMRAMTAAAAQKIKISENRMAHATEILFHIKENKLRFKEIPVSVIYTDYSKSKGQSVFNSVRIFFDLVLHKLFE
jgi:polyprenyl-phospho-N-acetylgalactosaminyl synthase